MPAKAAAAAQRPKQEIMHPFILQQLAAERVKDQLAAADDARRASGPPRSVTSLQAKDTAQPARHAGRT